MANNRVVYVRISRFRPGDKYPSDEKKDEDHHLSVGVPEDTQPCDAKIPIFFDRSSALAAWRELNYDARKNLIYCATKAGGDRQKFRHDAEIYAAHLHQDRVRHLIHELLGTMIFFEVPDWISPDSCDAWDKLPTAIQADLLEMIGCRKDDYQAPPGVLQRWWIEQTLPIQAALANIQFYIHGAVMRVISA